ncbi:hypothetical protein [Frisingicoccus sp.]|uniref:hypothetical protein n=1 Tax=Frisingicoccus sp. TaxID=1918627 RepID=UPI003AB8A79E
MEKNTKICNCCGRIIGQEEYVHIEKVWGYFSREKDGQKHVINLCEDCYDRLIRNFKYAPEILETTELI